MPNSTEFLSNKKSLLIAPAGYGKTYSIAECIKLLEGGGKQLILTHTHAGIASIKQKIKKKDIKNSSYHLETITGFAQKYVLAFYVGKIPDQEKTDEYYPFLISEAAKLFKLSPIKRIIKNTYNGLFVDEYQDCDLDHHALILVLSELFNTRILGDDLQGIYGFGQQLIRLKDEVFSSYYKKELDTPWRWENANKKDLGNDLKQIRSLLEDGKPIDLNNYSNIEVHKMTKENEHYLPNTKDSYGKTIYNKFARIVNNLKTEKSLLILFPNIGKYQRIESREIFVKRFGKDLRLLDAIDAKDFYIEAGLFDKATLTTINETIVNFLYKCFTKGNKDKGIDYWFQFSAFDENEIQSKSKIENNLDLLKTNIDFGIVNETLNLIYSLPKTACFRKELFFSICTALREAKMNNITVKKAMEGHRNIIRRTGKRVVGKCVGTTLLTKGLEFDTVLIINAHEFDCPKHLYVALTRATTRLIIFTKGTTLNPYKIAIKKTTKSNEKQITLDL